MHDSATDSAHLRMYSGQQRPDEESGLPALTGGEYEPHARPSPKPVYSLHFVSGQGSVRSFQYVHLDSGSSFAPECITLTFVGMEPCRVLIRGRNLWRLYDYIHQHRMTWVMEASRDFAKDGQTIVIRVSFTPLNASDESGAG